MVRWTFTVRDFHSIYTPPVLIGASRGEVFAEGLTRENTVCECFALTKG
jgi:hypothetical protein